MPLQKGSSNEAIAKNIAKMHHENDDKKRSDKQIIAIAYSIAKRSKK